MRRMATGLVLFWAGCGGSGAAGAAATMDESAGGETGGEIAEVEAVVAGEVQAIIDRDAEAFLALHAGDADAFLVGPVDVAVTEDPEAVSGMVRGVMAEASPATVSAVAHGLERRGDAAWSFHEVTITPVEPAPGEPSVTVYHATQVYRRTDDGWRVAASAWTIAIPEDRMAAIAMGPGFPDSAPITARADAGCEGIHEVVSTYRTEGTIPAADVIVGSLSGGTAPGEIGPLTAERHAELVARTDAGALQVSAGPGGVRAQRVGDLCFVANNIVVEAHPPEGPTLRLPMRQVVVAETGAPRALHANFSLVLPRRGPTAGE